MDKLDCGPACTSGSVDFFSHSQLSAKVIAKKHRTHKMTGAAAPRNFSHGVSISIGPAAVSKSSTMQRAATADIGTPRVAA